MMMKPESISAAMRIAMIRMAIVFVRCGFFFLFG